MTDEELEAALEARQGAAAIRDELQEQIDQASTAIKEALAERSRKRLVIGRWVPQIVTQERKTLDAKKLLSAGVTMPQIEAATTITEVVQLRVNPRGAGDTN